jgi:putative hydrolase of HD superfamily
VVLHRGSPSPKIAKDQAADLPGAVAAAVRGLIAEFEVTETLEARCAKDADKIECLLQAREYRRRATSWRSRGWTRC